MALERAKMPMTGCNFVQMPVGLGNSAHFLRRLSFIRQRFVNTGRKMVLCYAFVWSGFTIGKIKFG